MADLNSQTLHTGNSISIRIKNYEVGRAQSLSAQRNYGTEGVYELGNYMPVEHDYLKYEGTLTLTRMRVKKDDLAKIGFAAYGEDILKTAVFDIVVENKIDGGILEVYQGCSIIDYSTEYRANEFVSETARFYYLTAAKP